MSEQNEIGLIARMNERFASLAGFCFDYRWGVFALCVGLFTGAGHLASQIEIDASYEAYFFEGDTTYQSYETYREDFGSDEVSYIGYELPDLEYGPWNVKAMSALIGLTKALEDEVPFIYDVTTLANAELTRASEEGLGITRLKDVWPLTQAELLEYRDAFLA